MSATIHALPTPTGVPRPSADFGDDQRTYYLIFSDDAPPSITESWEEAQRWKQKGCEVETYTRRKVSH